MLLTIGSVLDDVALREVGELLETVSWRDGRETAGAGAASVKVNAQADLSGRAGRALRTRLRDLITGHPVFETAARVKRMSRLIVSRTGPGGGYGVHVDNALMRGQGERMRSDLAFTLFLSPPEAYEDGALVIDSPAGEQRIKPAAGDLVLYPATSLHQVAPVTRGERLACIGWVESLVRRADQREILFDLDTLRDSLPVGGAARLTLDKSVSNLLRLWAET